MYDGFAHTPDPLFNIMRVAERNYRKTATRTTVNRPYSVWLSLLKPDGISKRIVRQVLLIRSVAAHRPCRKAGR